MVSPDKLDGKDGLTNLSAIDKRVDLVTGGHVDTDSVVAGAGVLPVLPLLAVFSVNADIDVVVRSTGTLDGSILAVTLSIGVSLHKTIGADGVGMTEAEQEPLVSALIQPSWTLRQRVRFFTKQTLAKVESASTSSASAALTSLILSTLSSLTLASTLLLASLVSSSLLSTASVTSSASAVCEVRLCSVVRRRWGFILLGGVLVETSLCCFLLINEIFHDNFFK